jgi:hypothetical protein
MNMNLGRSDAEPPVDMNGTATFLQICIENAAQWAADGWGGYIDPGAFPGQSGGFIMITPTLNYTAARASMQPIFDFVASVAGGSNGTNASASLVTVGSFYEAYEQFIAPDEEVSTSTSVASASLVPVERCCSL